MVEDASDGDLIKQFGPDSFLGRTAATLYGSSETTCYVLAVYFGRRVKRRARGARRGHRRGDRHGRDRSWLFQ